MDDRADYDQNADYEFFVEQLPAILDAHRGQVVLISRREIVDYFDTMQDAVTAGMERFGPERFIAQDVVMEETVPVVYSMIY